MFTRKELLAPRPPGRVSAGGIEKTPWGERRRLSRCDRYEVHLERLVPDARRGIEIGRGGQRTIVVLGGALWTKDATSGEVVRHAPGACIVSPADRGVELATGRDGATLLVVQPPRFDAKIERLPATASPAPAFAAPAPSIAPPVPRIAQGTFQERTARTMTAQGLGRSQPLPVQPRTAADVSYSFSPQGTNLVPVVPEP